MTLLSGLLAFAAAGCSSPPWHQKAAESGQTFIDQGEPGKALEVLTAALRKSPNNAELKIKYQTAISQYKSSELAAAQDALSRNLLSQSQERIANVLRYDAHDMRAVQLQSDLDVAQRLLGALKTARALAEKDPQAALLQVNKILEERPGFLDARALQSELQRVTSEVDALQPALSPALHAPISLNFRDQRIMDIFESVSRMGGVNFVFDRDLQSDLTSSLYANNTTILDAINVLLATNNLSKKILNKNTLLIYPKSPGKDAEYQDMLVKTFYLANADPKQVFNALRQTLNVRSLYVDERLNAIVMRGTPGEAEVASRLISSLDLPQSEVTLDVSVLEVDKTAALDFGLLPPSQLGFSSQSTKSSNSGSDSNSSGYGNSFVRNKFGVVGFDGKALINLSAQEQDGHIRVLSNPKIRVRNREKATIKVGGRVPVITNSTTAVGTTQSANYQDTGLVLIVTPNIGLNDELSVHVQLDIVDVQKSNKAADGSLTYEFTNRSADTTMTARDNQTQVLGGLISYNSNYKNSGLPGIRSVLGVGKLFGQDNNKDDEKQIVLLITPHIDRSLHLPSAAATTFISGTQQQVNARSPLILRNGSGLSAPPGGGAQHPSMPPVDDTRRPSIPPVDDASDTQHLSMPPDGGEAQHLLAPAQAPTVPQLLKE